MVLLLVWSLWLFCASPMAFFIVNIIVIVIIIVIIIIIFISYHEF